MWFWLWFSLLFPPNPFCNPNYIYGADEPIVIMQCEEPVDCDDATIDTRRCTEVI